MSGPVIGAQSEKKEASALTPGMKAALDEKLFLFLSDMYPLLADKCNARAKNLKLNPEAHLDLFVAQFKFDENISPVNGTRDSDLLSRVQSKYLERKKST